MEIGAKISESDFASITPDGTFVQLEYIEEKEEKHPYKVEPGTWTIQKTALGMKLESTSFTDDKILDSFVATKNIEDKIDCFFRRLDVYRLHGIEVPKRGMLLYGSAGTGKTSASVKVCKKYAADGKTAVIVWGTDKIDPIEVKDFVKAFEYVGVEKMILVMEDIGGVEVDQVRMKSTSSLLSLLDNQEKVFTIPIFILATTNFPENFLGNLTNRPGRFDDKIEVSYPNGQARADLLKFFMKSEIKESALEYIKDKRFQKFSPAHIKEVVIRSAIYEMTIEDSMVSIAKEIELYENAFVSNKKKLGIRNDDSLFDD